jgi:hypothetical protein
MRRLEMEFLVLLTKYVSRIRELKIFEQFGREWKPEIEPLPLELDTLMLS